MLPLLTAGVTTIGCRVGSSAEFTQSQMTNVAPGTRSPLGSAAECFSIRTSPPTVKHAGPALRLLPGDFEGDSVVFATLQMRAPIGASAGMSTWNVRVKSSALLTRPNWPWSRTV